MIKPFTITPEYRCDNCNTDNIEVYDYFGRPIQYKQILDMIRISGKIPEIFKDKNIYTMKCKKCGKVFSMEWREKGLYPIPIKDNKPINTFTKVFISKETY